MKLRTSFFNGTVLKKDLTRFAPVWGLYTIFLFVLFVLTDLYDPALTANNLADGTTVMALISMVYAGVCANVLFGDLFNPRMCNALHAMPLRREGWFLTHVVSGLLFCLIPTVSISLLLMVILQEYYYMALLWLAVMVLEFLFFFGVGTLSVMCAGNRLGMAAMYLILNLFSGLIYVVADQLYEPLLYGIDLSSRICKFLSPVIWLGSNEAIDFTYSYREKLGTFQGLYWESWQYMIAVAVIGVLLMALSVLLYRKRKLERAGDFLAIKPLGPVFLIIVTFAGGVFLYGLSDRFGFSTSYLLMAIGIVVGFFVGAMLLERTVRVFRWKNLLGFAVFAVVFVGSMVVTWLDPLGITWYVPETEEVEFVRIYRDNDSLYGEPDFAGPQAETLEEIDRFRQIHGILATERGDKSDHVSEVGILYQLKNGETVRRYYSVDTQTAAYDTLQAHFSQTEYIFNVQDWDGFVESVDSIEISLATYYENEAAQTTIEDPQQIRELLAAIKADCDDGTMAQDNTYHADEDYAGWLFIDYDQPVLYVGEYAVDTGGSFQDLEVYPCNTHTLACLEKLLGVYRPEK